MNARLYDPVLGRMLSPDNFVHADAGLNGYNRYSYALNNPLKFTDPDGNHPLLIAVVVGAVVNAYLLTSQAEGSFNPMNWSWSSATFGNLALGGIIGAASGCVGYGFSAGIAVNGIGSAIFAGAVGGATGGAIGGAFNAAALGGDARDLGMGAIHGFVGGAILGAATGAASYYIGKFFASFKNKRAVPSTPDTPEPVTANELVKESVSIDPIEPATAPVKGGTTALEGQYEMLANRTSDYMQRGSRILKETSGASRDAQYGEYWQGASLKETQHMVGTGQRGVWNHDRTKILFSNPAGTRQIVYDPVGNYFRIENLTTKAKPYLMLNGDSPLKIPNINGKGMMDTPKDIYQWLTHFRNIDPR